MENGGGALFSVNSDGYVLLNTDNLDYEDEAFREQKEVKFTVSTELQTLRSKYHPICFVHSRIYIMILLPHEYSLNEGVCIEARVHND